MTARRKNFATYKPQGTDDVVMIDLNAGTERYASFPCNSRIPGIALVEFIAEMDEENPAAAGGAVLKFLKSAINPLHVEPFLEYVRDPINTVELDELIEICSWLAEQYTGGNPSQSSAPSSSGLPATGPSLSDARFSPEAQTYVTSTPEPSSPLL